MGACQGMSLRVGLAAPVASLLNVEKKNAAYEVEGDNLEDNI